MRFLRGLGSVLVALCLSVQCHAQGTQGSITGEVRDAAGAVVPNANVTVTDVATGVVHAVQTNVDGIFSVPNLIPGVYTVQVQATGFMTSIRTSIELQVQANIRLNFALHPGQGTETLAEGSAQLETENAGGGGVVENQRVANLPLEGRDYTSMVPLGSNSNNTSGDVQNFQGVGIGSTQGGSRSQTYFAIGGQRPSAGSYSLDGLPNQDVNYNLNDLSISIDAIKEVKVQTGIYPAEFGREIGQVNVSTLSGGNQYHGMLFEFLRNNKTDAVTYQFTPIAPVTPPFKWNQYGFTLNGPLSIPKVYNARNKLFFMVNFEGFNQRSLTNTVYTVPTVAQRGGDLSPGLAAAGGTGLVYSPFGRVQNADGSITATPIPGNIIPPSQIAPDSTIMMYYLPLPNQPVSGIANDNLASPATPVDKDQFTARLDFNETAKSAWFARFTWFNETTLTPLQVDDGTNLAVRGAQYLLANTRTFSATKVNEARFGIGTFHNNLTDLMGSNPGAPWALDLVKKMGLPGILTTQSPIAWGVPETHGMGGGFSNWGDTSGISVLNDTVLQGSDNFTWIHGKHSLRFGGLLRRDRYNPISGTTMDGFFAFAGYQASNPASPQSNQWTGWGAYLLGVPSAAGGIVNLSSGQLRSTSTGLYVDDSWHLSPTVTVSLGLRYEYYQPWWDKSGREANFAVPFLPSNVEIGNVQNMALHPTLVRTGSGNYYDGLLINFPGIQVARDGRLGRSLMNSDPKDFAPRLGLAWSPSDKWAVRLGAGVFYSLSHASPFFGTTKDTGGSFSVVNSNTLPSYTWTTYLTPGSTINIPAPSISGFNTNLKTPRTYQWMLEIQRKLSSSTMLVVNYSGSIARHLYYGYSINQPLAGTTSIASRTPFPELNVSTNSVQDADRSSYEAGAVRIQRRAHGITFTGSFTWGRSMDYGSENGYTTPQNARCLQCNEYAPSMFDVKYRLPLSFVYDLPFGKGEKFANTGGVINQIVGGWQLSVIYTIQTGLALPVEAVVDQANVGGVTVEHPNATGTSTYQANPSPAAWFNKAAYTTPVFGTFGNVDRDSVRGPGKNDGDLTLARNFKIREGHTLIFRFETYNAFNHPNWGIPDWFFSRVTFDTITRLGAAMRQIQFSMKYKF